MTGDSWYFAYGSNLWIDQKEERTGAVRRGIEGPRIARLKNFRLAFNKRGITGRVYANIEPADGEEVIGVIYRWNDEAKTKMENYERGYEELDVEVLTDAGDRFAAVTFVAMQQSICQEAVPSAEYLNRIIMGAREHGISEEYIRKIQGIAAGEEKNR